MVLIFYRGQWCPVCKKHLSHIQENLGKIIAIGATVVAISPEKPEYMYKTAQKTGAKFALLYDEDYLVADAYTVTFLPGAATRTIYNTTLRANLKEAHSDGSHRHKYQRFGIGRNLEPALTRRTEEHWIKNGNTPDKHLEFYCGTGWLGSEGWLNAWLMGCPRVSVYDGGWFEWSYPGNLICKPLKNWR